MPLTEHQPGDHYFIRDVGDDGIRIRGSRYDTSLLVTADSLLEDWPVRSLDDLDAAAIAPILELEPEVVILGVGRRQQFVSSEVQIEFLKRGIGLEVMTLDAACRTFNVLMSEDRKALAALIWEGQPRGGR